jgi:hypothetical protein
VAAAFIRNHNLAELIEQGRSPHDVWEAAEWLEGDWLVKHQNSGMEFLTEGDLLFTCAPSGPGYGDVLERDPELVMKDLRELSISHRTAREVFKVEYREESLVADHDATERAREQERRDRLSQATPYDDWFEGWTARRPPERVMTYYGDWPHGMSTPLQDWEPQDQLLDEHVRELGEPRERPSRY